MRRMIALGLVIGLVGAVSVSPALAKKKKPITFKASGSFAVGNPASYAAGLSIVGTELTSTCAMPATQGTDGYVVELSDAISKVVATVQVKGSDATGSYDLDMYFYNEECAPVGSSSTETSDEVGAFPAGTRYVLVDAYVGVEVEFELTATEMKS